MKERVCRVLRVWKNRKKPRFAGGCQVVEEMLWKLGFLVENVWGMHGKWMGYAGEVRGIGRGHGWNMYAQCLEYVGEIPGKDS